MKDYLKEDLSVEEKAEIISIIWRVARKYKYKRFKENENKMTLIEELDLTIEDTYNFNKIDYQVLRGVLRPFTEEQKTSVVRQLNMLMDELTLFDLKRTLTFNEKLVFFLINVENYKSTEVMKLLSVSRKTVYNRQKSIEKKIKGLKGEL